MLWMRLQKWWTRIPAHTIAREATLADVPQILALLNYHYAALGRQIDPESTQRHKELTDPKKYWHDAGGNFWVLTEGTKIIGTLSARPAKEDRRIAEFEWYYVSPEADGKGQSLLLLREAIEWLAKTGLSSIEFWSGEARTRAHRLYRRLGFKHDGVCQVSNRNKTPYRKLFFQRYVTPHEIQQMLACLPKK